MAKTAANLCNTSVDDMRSSLYHTDDFELIKNALKYEMDHGNRTTMIRILKAKIRQLEKSMR